MEHASIQSSSQVAVDTPRQFFLGKKRLRPCGYKGSCVAELAVPDSPYIRGLELSENETCRQKIYEWQSVARSSRSGMHVGNIQEWFHLQTQPASHRFMTLRRCVIVALSLFVSRLKTFGISVFDDWCIYFHVFCTSCIILRSALHCSPSIHHVQLRWPGYLSGSLVRWLAPQSQVLRGRRKVLEYDIVQSYQIYPRIW